MKNELVLLAGTRETCKALTEQLKGMLGKYIRIKSFASEEYLPPLIEDALIVYSSYLIHDEVKHVIAPSCEVITAHRTVNYQYIDYLLKYPRTQMSFL